MKQPKRLQGRRAGCWAEPAEPGHRQARLEGERCGQRRDWVPLRCWGSCGAVLGSAEEASFRETLPLSS